MPVLTVRHITTYRYKQPVAFGEHRLLLRPRDSYDQKLLEARLAIVPEPVELRWMHDVFGNCVEIARFSGRAAELRIDSTIRLDHSPTNVLDFQIEEYAKRYPFSYGADEMPDLARSIERQYLDPEHEIDRWARQFVRHDGRTDTGEMLAAMTHAIRQNLDYVAREESGIQDPLQTLRIGSGSCRDFAVLMMEGGAVARASPRISSPATCTCRRVRRAAGSAAEPRMPGCGSICRVRAGSNTTRPTTSSAATT